MLCDDCDYGVYHLGPCRLMTMIADWTTYMTSDDCDYEGGPAWTMTSEGCDYGVDHASDDCDYGGGPPSTMTSDDCDYGGGPPRTLTSDECDYGMDHLGP